MLDGEYKPPSDLLCDVDDGGTMQSALVRHGIPAGIFYGEPDLFNYAGVREAEQRWRAKHGTKT